MNKSSLHKVIAIVLTVALAFGQFGVSFFHNKHDAHETVVDLDHTVVLPHGEHCKVCAVDLMRGFLAEDIFFCFPEKQQTPFFLADTIESPDSIVLNSDGRAPPVAA